MALTKVSRGLLSTGIVDNSTTTAITIDSSENVGIGTGSPQKTLDVKGTFAISNSTTSYWNFDRDDSDGSLTIADTGTERMRISGSNVGIGTSSPASVLHATGSTGIILGAASGDNWQTAAIKPIDEGGSYKGSLAFYTHPTAASAGSPTERMRIDASGNVGIGTSSPSCKLEVESSSDADLVQVQSTASANNTILRLGVSGNDAVISGSGGSTGNLAFKTYGTERMRIDSVGAIFATGVRSSSSANSDLRYNTSNGEIYYQTSSERYKSNIADLEFDTSNLYNLRPVSFDDNETGERCFGLIAEETFEQIPEAVVTRDIDGETVPDSIPYSMLSVLIINELKKLKVENDSLKARLTALENN